MTGEALIALIVTLSILAAIGWLVAVAARWLWRQASHLKRQRSHLTPQPRPAQVRWIESPAAPRPGHGDASASDKTQPHREPRGENMSFGIQRSSVGLVWLGPSRHVRLDEPVPWTGPRIRRGEPLMVRPRPAPLWAEKGWQKEGNTYHGHFRANGRSWRGRIEVPYPGGYTVYIWDPPIPELEAINHPHRPCFMDKAREGSSERYRVHFRSTPSSLDHAIANIEQILQEVMEGRR